MLEGREVKAPYPGLRPFEAHEAEIFFGREEHTDRLLEILQRERFLAVIGPSGAGKSSLVRAGLLPALSAGWLGGSSDWRIAVLRPGERPFRRLSEAMVSSGAVASEGPEESTLPTIEAELRRGPLGLVHLVAEAHRSATQERGFKLLVLVDQFEEIFRYAQVGGPEADESEAFVNLLLASRAVADAGISVALTMRTDFLGHCVRFLDLPDAINRAQYLTPRLTRTELEQAITGPALVFGGDVAPELVNELINSLDQDFDQLPLLQHALARMWAGEAEAGSGAPTLTLESLRRLGGLQGALSAHAEEVFGRLSEADQTRAEALFRCITLRESTDSAAPSTRRPQRLALISSVAACPWSDLEHVLNAFAADGVNFLHYGKPLGPESVIDISHEALARKWHRLADWTKEEAERTSTERNLLSRAAAWSVQQGELLKGTDLESARRWRTKTLRSLDLLVEGRTDSPAASQYKNIDMLLQYVSASEVEERHQEDVAQESEKARLRTQTTRFILATTTSILFGVVLIVLYFWYSNNRARNLEIAETLLSSGRSLLDEGRSSDALAPLSAAATLAQSLDASQLEADAYRALGDAFSKSNAPKEAVENLVASADLYSELKDKSQELSTRNHAAATAFRAGEYEQAVLEFTKAASLPVSSIGAGSAVADLNLAASLYHTSDLGKSKIILTSALSSFTSHSEDIDKRIAAFYWLARIENDRRNFTEALRLIQSAVSLERSLASELRATDQFAFLPSTDELYDEFVDILIALHIQSPEMRYAEAALEISDTSRHQATVSRLFQRRRLATDSEQLVLRSKTVEDLRLLLPSLSSPLRATEYRTAREQKAVEERLRSLNDADRHYLQLTGAETRISLQDIKSSLDDSTQLLEFRLAERKSFLWIVTQDSVEIVILPGEKIINKEVSGIFGSYPHRGSERVVSMPWIERARGVSEMLFGGETFSKLNKKRLVIVADGSLSSVPFSALPEPSSSERLLVEDFEIVNVPSVLILHMIRETRRPNSPRSFAILSHDDRNTLPYTRHEADEIQKILAQRSDFTLFKGEASRRSLTDPLIQQTDVLHIAVGSDCLGGELPIAGLRLADGMTWSFEISMLPLQTSLAILSTCDNCQRSWRSDETGLLSLAFLEAGVPGVISFLGTADDRQASEQMAELYSVMIAKRASPPEALRMVQLGRLRSKDRITASPEVWGRLAFTGDWQWGSPPP